MTPKRLFYVLFLVLAITMGGLVGATYELASMLQAKSAQLADKKAEVAVLNSQQSGLVQAKKDVERYSALKDITKTIVPQDKDQAQTVREITNIAAANRVSLTTITFPSSNLGGSGSGPKSPAAAAAAKPNLSQLTPVANIPGVYNLQITVGNNPNNTVTFSQLDAFLRGLENNRRTAAVSTISIQPQQDRPNQLVFSLVINTYIKPS